MWHWEKVSVNVGGSSGDLAKLFKNEQVKCPSLLAANAPSADAVLLAREVIQNSWDAAIELKKSMADGGEIYPGFAIDFEFQHLTGDERTQMVEVLGLTSVADRLHSLTTAPSDQTAVSAISLGLSEGSFLESLNTSSPLSILKITESGATGMYGPWSGDKSKLFVAMIYFGTTIKPAGSGGSYGFGKSGLIRGSRTRTVIAYTCFKEREDDPGVTRRLLGVNYWGRHVIANTSFSGFGRLGAPDGEYVKPFENEEADEFAVKLGMRMRDSSNVEDLGTTFLLVDPSVEPEELNEAVLRNWWPAVLDHDFSVQIFPYSGGKVLHPKPKKSELLRPFVEAYDIARYSQDNPVGEDRRKFAISSVPNQAGGAVVRFGDLGLAAELGGWSYPKPSIDSDADEDHPIEHRSLVALVRGPKMVVEYFEVGTRQPFIRGTFIASPDIDDVLRQTEPAAHDSWQVKASDGVAEEATSVAKKTLDAIRRRVDEFRSDLKPETPKPEDIRLPELEKLFKKLINGDGPIPPPPPPGERDVSISIKALELDEYGEDGLIFLKAAAEFKLIENIKESMSNTSPKIVQILAKAQFLEDEKRKDIVPLSSVIIDGIEVENYSLTEGIQKEFNHDQVILLSFETEPFSADASCSALFDARLLVGVEGGSDE